MSGVDLKRQYDFLGFMGNTTWVKTFILVKFVDFSISYSLIELMKNEFTTLFLKYVLQSLFPFGVLGSRFEQTLTKRSWNIYINKKIIKYISDVIFICNNIFISN